jgi:hypothetical protein
MEYSLLLRKQAHELKMRQMVEEINFNCHTIESVMSKYQVLTRSTVTKWLERVRQEEQARTLAMWKTPRKIYLLHLLSKWWCRPMRLPARSSSCKNNSNKPSCRCSTIRM